MDDACSIPTCPKPVLARGWCRAHYKRWASHGDPTAGRPSPRSFWESVDKLPSGCWEWTGQRDSMGYGICGKGPSQMYSKYAHRRAWQMEIGPVPDGHELDHLCRNHPCVNPAHLEPVTHQENVARGLHGRVRTHCPHGHEYTPENTYVYRDRKHCRACNREASRRYNAESRGRLG